MRSDRSEWNHHLPRVPNGEITAFDGSPLPTYPLCLKCWRQILQADSVGVARRRTNRVCWVLVDLSSDRAILVTPTSVRTLPTTENPMSHRIAKVRDARESSRICSSVLTFSTAARRIYCVEFAFHGNYDTARVGRGPYQ